MQGVEWFIPQRRMGLLEARASQALTSRPQAKLSTLETAAADGGNGIPVQTVVDTPAEECATSQSVL